jgi:DNA-directed RNA polymerase subunit M/transcription elongation factor TFIIS
MSAAQEPVQIAVNGKDFSCRCGTEWFWKKTVTGHDLPLTTTYACVFCTRVWSTTGGPMAMIHP